MSDKKCLTCVYYRTENVMLKREIQKLLGIIKRLQAIIKKALTLADWMIKDNQKALKAGGLARAAWAHKNALHNAGQAFWKVLNGGQ